MTKKTKTGFTLVELLVVISIIALLAGILIPALGIARKMAKETAARAMIHAIETGLEMFSNDFGSYPQSEERAALDTGGPNSTQSGARDIGAHRLVEAMGGIDLLGYTATNDYRMNADGSPQEIRKNAYVEMDKMSVFNPRVMTGDDRGREWDRLNVSSTNNAVRNNLNPIFTTQIHPQKPRPVLYYRAARNEHLISDIYNANHNALITQEQDGGVYKYPAFISNPVNYDSPPSGATQTFEKAIWNPTTSANVTARQARPNNPKTFLLISAGYDGLYGTDDDITNCCN